MALRGACCDTFGQYLRVSAHTDDRGRGATAVCAVMRGDAWSTRLWCAKQNGGAQRGMYSDAVMRRGGMTTALHTITNQTAFLQIISGPRRLAWPRQVLGESSLLFYPSSQVPSQHNSSTRCSTSKQTSRRSSCQQSPSPSLSVVGSLPGKRPATLRGDIGPPKLIGPTKLIASSETSPSALDPPEADIYGFTLPPSSCVPHTHTLSLSLSPPRLLCSRILLCYRCLLLLDLLLPLLFTWSFYCHLYRTVASTR